MKQIIQNLNSGETILENVPAPLVKKGAVLIKTHRTLVSLGTERMLVQFGKGNLIEKALQQPEKVKQVINKIKTDGLKPTMDSVFRKLNEPLPLGYCNAGEVIQVGEGVQEFKIGDRVISNGHHAEVVCIPQNLCAKIPHNVTYDEASFTVIGAIGLQGVRLINPTFGETIVVIGLGLIGLMTIQFLKANGCQVVGVDFDQNKVELGNQLGINCFNVSNLNPVDAISSLTNGIGADGVIITASTKSNEVIAQAAQMCRKRGRIVLVGVIGLEIQRADFYEKEITFQVSCSYGPGRYDDVYEQKGVDYPLPYVRWTEKRNFEAVLKAIELGQVLVKDLITNHVPLANFLSIYGNMSNSDSIASILEYDVQNTSLQNVITLHSKSFDKQKGIIGIIGAGNFTGAMILPMLQKANASIKYIASSKGLNGTTLAKKYSIAQSTTDYKQILNDEEVNAVVITTRHDVHANQVMEALALGKDVFVEKPLALNLISLDQIEQTYLKSNKSLTVGFNRRFSPFAIDAKKQLGEMPSPMNIVFTMNAGEIPSASWVHDVEIGGGRIIGEACHMVDLITFLTGSLVKEVMMVALGTQPLQNTDNASIHLKYQNGSVGVINYFSNGSKAYSKERVEIFNQNKTIIIDNFKRSDYFGYKSSGLKSTQDKGHRNQFQFFVDRLKNGGDAIIPFSQLMNTSRATILALKSLKDGQWQQV